MNLDLEAAKTAAALAKDAGGRGVDKGKAEKLVRGASSVLAHQGLSAYFLHLKAEGPQPQKPNKPPKQASKDEVWAEELARRSYGLLQTAWGKGLLADIAWEKAGSIDHRQILIQSQTRLDNIGRFSEDLPRLIAGKQLVEQMLVYLRYHCKTLPEKEGT